MDKETDAVMTLRGGGESDDDWERRMDEETDATMKECAKKYTGLRRMLMSGSVKK